MKYNKQFVDGMRKAGKIAAQVLNTTAKYAKEGATTNELDRIADDVTKSLGAISACVGYNGYPKAICTSVNDVICHGVPDDTKLKAGDIINIDVTVKLKSGHHGDTSLTLFITPLPTFVNNHPYPETAPIINVDCVRLINASKEARDAGIRAIRPGGKTGDVGYATRTAMKKYPQFSIAPDIGGHGIGLKFHEAPFIPGYADFGKGEWIKPWTCLTVEPVIVDGSPDHISIPIENSSVLVYKTSSGKNACQFEHTVLVTDSGYEILTVE